MLESVHGIVERDGLLVTDVARTALDVALGSTFAYAVGTADWALWQWNEVRVDKDELRRELSRRAPRYGKRHAEAVIDFATSLSDSYGESVARGVMRELGFAVPELQVRFTDSQGDMVVDYFWRREGIVGEFDGKSKYLRPLFQTDLEPGERLWVEKKREDRLRRQVAGVVRIVWADLMAPSKLAAMLTDAGIPRR